MSFFPLSSETAQTVHLLAEWGAIAIGVQVYRWQRARAGHNGILQPGQYAIVVGCILGAAMGNKLVFWLEFAPLWSPSAADLGMLLSGQSIVGGLLGGLIGVELAKAITGQRQSTGDAFVLPLIVGTVLGRMGCFLAGLHDGTYGNATALPWGVDFGDGIVRHPTQLYDMFFVLLWGGVLLAYRQHWAGAPGLMFKLYLAGYLLWRLLIDAIKPIPFAFAWGMSGIQWVCLLALVCYLPVVVRQFWLLPSLPVKNH